MTTSVKVPLRGGQAAFLQGLRAQAITAEQLFQETAYGIASAEGEIAATTKVQVVLDVPEPHILLTPAEPEKKP